MTPSPHEAVLVGPAAAALRTMLADLLPGARLTEHGDLYGAVPGLIEREPDSVWLDGDQLGDEDVGAIRLLRRAWPDCMVVLLLAANAPAPWLDSVLRLGCRTLSRPARLRDVSVLLGAERAAPIEGGRKGLIAGLADQLNNPLAALFGRLQLLRIALEAGDLRDLDDNLALAVQSAERMQRAIDKLAQLGGLARPRLRTFRIGPLLAELAAASGGKLAAAGEDYEVIGDDDLVRVALGNVAAVLLDLAAGERATLRTEATRRECAVAITVEGGLPMPCPAAEILEPFRLQRLLADTDRGVDLAVASALLAAQDSRLAPRVDRGFLRGFVCTLPLR